MTKVVVSVITLIFKRIECFIFNFPSGSAGFHEIFNIILRDGNVSYPRGAERSLLLIGNFIFEKINVVLL